MQALVGLRARDSAACCRRDWPFRFSWWPGRCRWYGYRAPSALSDGQRHARQRREPWSACHWLLRRARSSLCPWASWYGYGRQTRSLRSRPHSFLTDRQYPPKRRMWYWPCPAAPAIVPRHNGTHRWLSIAGSARVGGQFQHGSYNQRREWRYRWHASSHPAFVWPWNI